MERNLVVDGMVKSGKTTGVIMPLVRKMIDNSDSLLIVDKNAEYYNHFAPLLKEKGYDVKVLNLSNPLKSDVINVFDLPYEYYKNGDEKAYDEIENIAKSIFFEENSMDPFWQNSAADLFSGIVIKLIQVAKKEEVNFQSIYNFMSLFESEESVKELKKYFTENGLSDPAYLYVSSILVAPPETRMSILSVASTKLKNIVIRKNILNIINNSSFDLKDFISKKSALFIICGDNYNVFANIIIREIYEIYNGNKYNMILDNFDLLKPIYDFKTLFNNSQDKNINVVIGTRNMDNLIKNYDDDLYKLADVAKVLDEVRYISLNKEKVMPKEIFQLKDEVASLPDTLNKILPVFNVLEDMAKKA